jgi:DNA invertase Pin-like site-specific DNA recombinase
MPVAIEYLRVSTREQGRRGVGLAAQRHEIERFAAQEGLEVSSWHRDIQTGGGADALMLRPGLAQALKEAKSTRCPLIVSKLDRLARNVHFISGLMEHRVHFMVSTVPGVGPIVSTAIVASVGNARVFRKARDMAA